MLVKLAKLSDNKGLSSVVAIFAFVVLELFRRRRLRPRGATFVPGDWLLGNAREVLSAIRKNQHYELGVHFHKVFGRTLALKFPFRPWIVKTTCPKNVEHILKANFDNYPKGASFQSRLCELLGVGIFNSDGKSWYKQRKVASRMFTNTLFREHIWAAVKRNARKLKEVVEFTDPSEPVDVFNLMNRFTLDTIGEIGFGKCIGSLEDPQSPFLEAFDKAQNISFWRFRNPFWRLARFLGVGSESETREQFGRLDAYSRSIVREVQLCVGFGSKHEGRNKSSSVGWADIEARKSFLGLFVEEARSRGETLSEDFLRDLVMNFLIAGRDTTAAALSWAIYCLSQHPEVEAAARKEVIDVCGVRGPTYEEIQRLPYLQAVISEVLRLYPSVPVDVKVALDDDTLPDGTFVPAGANVAYDIYSMGRDTSIWGEDAESFRPERWLEMKQNPGNYEHAVFNAGPRECLGRRLAMVEMKTCLAVLLPQVSFQLAVPSDQVTPGAQLTIGMAQGLPCFVTRAAKRERQASSVSTAYDTSLSDRDETNRQSDCLASSEAEQTCDESDFSEAPSHFSSMSDCTSETGTDCSSKRSRVRGKKRKSGWSRHRQSKFWQRVRESTPERWPEDDAPFLAAFHAEIQSGPMLSHSNSLRDSFC